MGQSDTVTQNILLAICVLFLIVTKVVAQNGACSSSEATIVITFPENDSPTLPFNDPRYTQAIFTSGQEPFSVVIDPDPQDTTNQYKFPDYFDDQWNTQTNSYTVRMKKGIDRDGNTSSTSDDVNILQYKVSCTETQGSTTIVYRILKIQITDVNDNSPYFNNAPYTVRVNELTPVGVTVFRGILADDLDEGPNKQITYILTPGFSQYNFNGTQYFFLPSDQEGILSVSNPLDFESMYRQTGDINQTFYNITVIARDNAVPASTQRSSLTTLRVIITDGDDQGPEFVYPSCIQSSQPNSKSCIRPKYLTSVYSGNSSEINLDLKPDPSDSSNPTVYMLMQDRDTLNSAVTCAIRQTEPAGYESYFTARSSFYSGKQYRCEIVKLANKIFNRANISSLEIVIEVVL
ncbi:Cadherin-99C [Bulinus truncatus]|nr:Cadherin-99C [Bulinus truncatus]